jgi:hypothetical protein
MVYCFNLLCFQHTHIGQILNRHRWRHLVISDLLHNKFSNRLCSFSGGKTIIAPAGPACSSDALAACHYPRAHGESMSTL